MVGSAGGEDRFPDTRWSLVRRLDAHAGTASVLLVDAYADATARYVRSRLRDVPAELLDDIIQDVLVHLLEHPDILARAQPGPGSRFRHYLMHVAWNEARNALRRRRRETGLALEDEEASHEAAPATGMDRAWAASVLTQAWNELRARRDSGDIDAAVVAITEAHLIRGESLRSCVEQGMGSLATCSRRLAHGRMLVQQAIVERLRHAGELAEDEMPTQACERMLDLLGGTAPG
jgi:RNA polymerase sigma factor (sigma-70 family)